MVKDGVNKQEGEQRLYSQAFSDEKIKKKMGKKGVSYTAPSTKDVSLGPSFAILSTNPKCKLLGSVSL